jgi:diaminopimelate epimerase
VSSASEPKRATALTDRKTGIGCDQLIIMEVGNVLMPATPRVLHITALRIRSGATGMR